MAKISCLGSMVDASSIADMFTMIKDAGFDGIDLKGDLVGDHVDEIDALINKTGLPVPTVYGRLTTPLLSRTIAERQEGMALARRRLTAAAAIGAQNMVVVPVFGEARITADLGDGVEAVENAVLATLLSELEEHAAEVGVRMVLEPLNRRQTHLLISPTRTAQLSRSLNSPWIGTMVDTYHADLENQDLVEEFQGCGDQLMLVHLSDRDRSLPGQGGIDFAPLLRTARESGYDGFFGYECNGPFTVEQLATSLDWVREQEQVAT